MMSEVSVLGEPMFVNSDGLLYVLKRTGVEPRDLTKEEEVAFGGKVKVAVRPTKGRVGGGVAKEKEKGITIKVVEKMEEEDKVE